MSYVNFTADTAFELKAKLEQATLNKDASQVLELRDKLENLFLQYSKSRSSCVSWRLREKSTDWTVLACIFLAGFVFLLVPMITLALLERTMGNASEEEYYLRWREMIPYVAVFAVLVLISFPIAIVTRCSMRNTRREWKKSLEIKV